MPGDEEALLTRVRSAREDADRLRGRALRLLSALVTSAQISAEALAAAATTSDANREQLILASKWARENVELYNDIVARLRGVAP